MSRICGLEVRFGTIIDALDMETLLVVVRLCPLDVLDVDLVVWVAVIDRLDVGTFLVIVDV